MGQKPNLRRKNVTSRQKRARTFFVEPQGQMNDRSILLKAQTNKKSFVPVRFPIFVLRPPYSPLLLQANSFVLQKKSSQEIQSGNNIFALEVSL